MATPTMEHRRVKDIEILRAVAILATLAVHLAFLFPWWSNGRAPAFFAFVDLRVGVDLFFVISGYVIARGALDKFAWDRGWALFWRNAVAFWIRRAWRIWPAAWLWLLLIGVASVTLQGHGPFRGGEQLRGLLLETAASVAQVMNLWMVEVVIFDPTAPRSAGATNVYWSLSLEEQFYLLLPLAAWVFRRYLSWVLVGIVAVMFFLNKIPGTVWSFLRFDPIVLGVLLAMWSRRPSYSLFEPRFLLTGAVRKVLFLLAVFFAAALIMGVRSVSVVHGVAGALCAGLVYAASFDKGYLFPAGRVHALLLWVGSRSYAIYLSHALLFQVTRAVWEMAMPRGFTPGSSLALPYLLTGMALVAGASELTYRLVEVPLRARGRAIADRYVDRERVAPRELVT